MGIMIFMINMKLVVNYWMVVVEIWKLVINVGKVVVNSVWVMKVVNVLISKVNIS